jgi:hypothetical protein
VQHQGVRVCTPHRPVLGACRHPFSSLPVTSSGRIAANLLVKRYVGDSPEGPLKQLRKSRLKPAKKPKLNAPCLSAHTRHGPLRGGPRGPPRRPTQRPPRAGSASLEGTHLPRAGSAPLEDAPHAHDRSRTRVRAFNALTTTGRRHHVPGTHAPVLLHQLPRGNPFPPLWGTVRRGRCQPRDAAPPTPVRLTCRALEGGRPDPRNAFP